MNFLKLTSFLFVPLVLISCTREEIIYDAEPDLLYNLPLILEFDGKPCFLNLTNKTLKYSVSSFDSFIFSPKVRFQDFNNIFFEQTRLQNNTINNFGYVKPNIEYQLVITSASQIDTFKLIFTSAPLIRIVVPYNIVDERKTLAKMEVNDPSMSNILESFIGIEIRGNSTRKYPKKSYGISFCEEQDLNTKVHRSVFGMKKASNFVMDAMYIDKSRIRNTLSCEIWDMLNDTFPTYHYSIQTKYTELFINNNSLGIYCFSELMGRELLGLTLDFMLLYKAVGEGKDIFKEYSSAVSKTKLWDGWEQKYPENFINWQPLKALREVVVNATDEEFRNEIFQFVDLHNVVDYFIFMNLTSAWDNTGQNKNMFLFRRSENMPFTIIPWDLDYTWGLMWVEEKINADWIITSNLFDRLYLTNAGGYRYKVKNRWFNLRQQTLSNDNLLKIVAEKFKEVESTHLIEYDNNRWGFRELYGEEKDFIMKWTQERVKFLDHYFMTQF